MKVAPFLEQKIKWPDEGNHILAQYNDDSIVVYQAYGNSIGNFAVNNQYFGGSFSYSRWSWIKTSFLWMMYRSGWGTKKGQETILNVTIKKDFFDSILRLAVESIWSNEIYSTEKDWKADIARSDLRLQWDPDRTPSGGRLKRRASQLGLRNIALKEYSKNAIVNIEDISKFVSEQRKHISDLHNLEIQIQKVYFPLI